MIKDNAKTTIDTAVSDFIDKNINYSCFVNSASHKNDGNLAVVLECKGVNDTIGVHFIRYLTKQYNQNTNTTDPSYNQPMNTSTGSSDDGFDGSSALVGAAAGAAAGYGLANANNNRKRKEDVSYIVPPSNGNDTSRTRNNNAVAAAGAATGAAASKTTSKPSSKSSTTRGGFGSTGSKSFGG